MGKSIASIALISEPKKPKQFTPQPLKLCTLGFAPTQMVTCLAIDSGRLLAGNNNGLKSSLLTVRMIRCVPVTR